MKTLNTKFFICALLMTFAASFILPRIANANHGTRINSGQIRVPNGYSTGTAYTSARYHDRKKQIRRSDVTRRICFDICEIAYLEEFPDLSRTSDEECE